MTTTTIVQTIYPWNPATLELEKANAKRRLLGQWLAPLPTDVSGVHVEVSTRTVRGELEATLTFTLDP